MANKTKIIDGVDVSECNYANKELLFEHKIKKYETALDEIEEAIDRMAKIAILTFPDFSIKENLKMVIAQCNSGYGVIQNIINKVRGNNE